MQVAHRIALKSRVAAGCASPRCRFKATRDSTPSRLSNPLTNFRIIAREHESGPDFVLSPARESVHAFARNRSDSAVSNRAIFQSNFQLSCFALRQLAKLDRQLHTTVLARLLFHSVSSEAEIVDRKLAVLSFIPAFLELRMNWGGGRLFVDRKLRLALS